MDNATVAMGVQLALAALQTVRQYQNGEISAEEAHAQLVAASANLRSAIELFNRAVSKPSA